MAGRRPRSGRRRAGESMPFTLSGCRRKQTFLCRGMRQHPVRADRHERIPRSDLQAELAESEDRLRAVAYVERLEDGGDVDLHRAFGDVELARDDLVRLALDHELEHLQLALGQVERRK